MEPKPQIDGSGGKIGGPPPVACGFFGDDDESGKPRARRAVPATLKEQLRALRLYFKDIVAESSRLQWPKKREFLETTLFMISFTVVLFTLGFV